MTAPVLPDCRHRGGEVLPGRWLCRSPRLVRATGLVSGETCRSRCPYVDHADGPPRPAGRPGGPASAPDRATGVGPGRQGVAPVRAFEWVTTARLVADAVTLAGLLPVDCPAVAGIPRSGMLPAAVVATHLHLPLYELTESGQLNRLGHGSRGRALGFPGGGRAGPVAVVDDTVYGGGAMRSARGHAGRLGLRAVFAAVYARPEAAGVVDVYARPLPSPHLLEWNVTNNGPFAGLAANPVYRAGVALDLDGVIIHDAVSGGPVGTPYLVPRTHACRLIATGRPGRYRAETESLLRRLGTRWERLEMLPDGTPVTDQAIAHHKARHYAASGCGFFVESDPVQAELIFRMSGRPTICPRTGQVWPSGAPSGVGG